MNHNYLVHHGIDGQKWGRRNGPPYPLSAGAHSSTEKKAGTSGWTSEAKSMSTEDLRKAVNRKRLENDYYRAQSNSGANKKANEKLNTAAKGIRVAGQAAGTMAAVASANNKGQTANELNKTSKTANKTADQLSKSKVQVEKPEDVSKMSDSDLRKLVDRMSLEMQYDELYGTKSSGEKHVAEVLDATGDALAIGRTAIEIAAALGVASVAKKTVDKIAFERAAKLLVPGI